jgi:Tat protein secretion system quality control protein TatD with DNase activity
MVEQAEQTVGEAEARDRDLVVIIHDEDAGGEPYKITSELSAKVETVIHRFYKKLDTTRKDGDRLVCLANGNDVFAHAEQRLDEYARHECAALEWGFSRDTGGA